jgi:hypothetical protein
MDSGAEQEWPSEENAFDFVGKAGHGMSPLKVYFIVYNLEWWDEVGLPRRYGPINLSKMYSKI